MFTKFDDKNERGRVRKKGLGKNPNASKRNAM
jgi:hypothetical protein